MGHPRNSGEWAKAIAHEQKLKRISNASALTAFLLSTAINWAPTEPDRKGRPALYWRNRDAAAFLGIDWRTFERHRSDLRKAGLIGLDQDGNLVPLLTVKTDAVNADAVKTVGPYKESYSRKTLQGSSFEVEGDTVSIDGAPPGAVDRSQVPWSRLPSLQGSADPEPVGEAFSPPPHWGWGGEV